MRYENVQIPPGATAVNRRNLPLVKVKKYMIMRCDHVPVTWPTHSTVRTNPLGATKVSRRNLYHELKSGKGKVVNTTPTMGFSTKYPRVRIPCVMGSHKHRSNNNIIKIGF